MTQPPDDRLLGAVAAVAREEHLQLLSQDLADPVFAELSEDERQLLASAVTEQLAREPREAATPEVVSPEAAPPEAARFSAARLPRGLRQRLSWLAAAAALFCGALWLLESLPRGAEPLTAQAPAIEPQRQLTLPDGSTLALGEQTQARVLTLGPREVRVQLERGSVQCEVAHDPGRRFVVAAGGFEVVVRGTRFTVSAGLDATAPEQVVVSVEQGVVEVQQAPDRLLARLGAGQRWSSDGRPAPSLPEPAEERPAVEPAALPDAAARRDEPAAIPSVPAAAPRPAAPPAPAALPRQSTAPSARQLFERADAERLAGRAREAAAAFDQLRRRHPGDARAGYAAFMLGRIRLDSLADPGGAAEAFEFALQHADRSGGGFFREDAAARRVEALDQAGRASECLAAREQFLRRYPASARAPLVTRLCNER